MDSVNQIQRKTCAVCRSSALEQVIDLPRFPLTGIFLKPDDKRTFPLCDQALMRCGNCGHGQLRNSLDPVFLYQDTYSHRSSLSSISTSGNEFFLTFLRDVTGTVRFRSIVEIGCNDGFLLKKLEERADRLLGFDPIWRDREGNLGNKIELSGKYIEEIVPATDIPERPDLVISVHTLEHVNEPFRYLKPIFDHARDGAYFFLEVPSLDSLVRIARFDQVFHQHVNYFSLASLQRMVYDLGGEYLTHRFNYGYWLGTLMIAFRKPTGARKDIPPFAATLPPPTKSEINAQYEVFSGQMRSLRGSMEFYARQDVPLYGFGAAQMVPALAYHLDSDLGMLNGIVDDNPDKRGCTYPGLKVSIVGLDDVKSPADSAMVITAADSARPILKRLLTLGVRYVLVPFHTI